MSVKSERGGAGSARGDTERVLALVDRLVESNPFYREKLGPIVMRGGIDDLAQLPFTEKRELVVDQERHPPFGSDLSLPVSAYTRVHQTSGTTGNPLRWLDTAESWSWWLDCWNEVYRAAGVGPEDRVFVPFSFGPFVGFWAAFEAGPRLGCLTVPGGGLTSEQRVEKLFEYEATVVVCTPTYALRLAQVARAMGRDLAASPVRITIHAGEPGASLPNVRGQIEAAWGARCYDHAGATEVGAWGYSCGEQDHMHINDEAFVAEVIDAEAPDSVAHDPSGGPVRGELVLTNLGRDASPVIRYRTGDLVELHRSPCACGRNGAWIKGGVLGRSDQMVTIRGINVYPGAVDNIVRGHASIEEYEVRIGSDRAMDELNITVELAPGASAASAAELAADIHHRLHLRATVDIAPGGSLPRYELKARRFRRRT